MISPQRQVMVEYARSLIGTKWRHRGRKPWAVDCIGILVLSIRAAGGTIKDRLDYGREPWKDGLQEALEERFGEPISLEEAQPGDVVLFQFPDKEPSHIGILADYVHGGLSVIHSMQLKNVAEHGLSKVGKFMKIVGVYRTWPM